MPKDYNFLTYSGGHYVISKKVDDKLIFFYCMSKFQGLEEHHTLNFLPKDLLMLLNNFIL